MGLRTLLARHVTVGFLSMALLWKVPEQLQIG